MDAGTIGTLGILALATLIIAGVPLAFSIGVVGIIANSVLVGPSQTGLQIWQVTFQSTTDFIMTSIPLFVLMGQLVSAGGLGRDLYECVYKWLGRVPGGLAVTSVVSCAAFGAIAGVSSAGISAMAPIAIPQMQRFGYDNRLAAGSLASASTLAIMIPPSLAFVVYGIWTDTSIGKLFIAGILPGILMATLFSIYIMVLCTLRPELGPVGPRFPLRERLAALIKVVPVVLVFGLMVGGLYMGWFTPSEGAAVGCSAVVVILVAMRRLSWADTAQALVDTARLSVMIFAIVIAVQVFTRFLVLTDIPPAIVSAISQTGLPTWVTLSMIMLLYLVLGMFLDSIGMLLLTLPFVFPVIRHLGVDPVLFGVVLTVMVEIGLLTPPVGMNCYILNQLVPSVSLGEIFRGVMPFVVICLLCVVLFLAWPEFVLWLPNKAF